MYDLCDYMLPQYGMHYITVSACSYGHSRRNELLGIGVENKINRDHPTQTVVHLPRCAGILSIEAGARTTTVDRRRSRWTPAHPEVGAAQGENRHKTRINVYIYSKLQLYELLLTSGVYVSSARFFSKTSQGMMHAFSRFGRRLNALC